MRTEVLCAVGQEDIGFTLFQSMAPSLRIPDLENAIIEELKKVLTSLLARLKSDCANPAAAETILVQ